MNRTTKVAAFAVVGAAAGGLAVLAARMLRGEPSDTSGYEPGCRRIETVTATFGEEAASNDERPPTPAEFALISLVQHPYGWPATSVNTRYGTGPNGPYLLLPIANSEAVPHDARVEFAGSDDTKFVVVSYNGTPTAGPLSASNLTYNEAARMIGRL